MSKGFKPADDETILHTVSAVNRHPGIHTIAGAYAAEHGLSPGDRARVTSLLAHACADFLMRGCSKQQGDRFTREAKTLRNAMAILQRYGDIFPSHIQTLDDGECASRALQALGTMAEGFERAGKDFSQFPQNYSLQFCVQQQFDGHTMPRPTPSDIRTLAGLLLEALGDQHPPVPRNLSARSALTTAT